jgi:hypothetical protein
MDMFIIRKPLEALTGFILVIDYKLKKPAPMPEPDIFFGFNF